MTLEDVFVRRLFNDPHQALEKVREFLSTEPVGESFTREVYDRHLLPWISLNEDNEELARQVIGGDLLAILRPI